MSTNLSDNKANIWAKLSFLTPKLGSVTLICKCINPPFCLVTDMALGQQDKKLGSDYIYVGSLKPYLGVTYVFLHQKIAL